MPKLQIIGEYIELDKLLKAAGLCGTGGEARVVIRDGLVKVDGEVETRLRRKMRSGMSVDYDGQIIAVC